jgi:hypothetical protein
MSGDESELSEAASMSDYEHDADKSRSMSMATSSQELPKTGRLTSRATPSRLARQTRGFYEESDADENDDDLPQTANDRRKSMTQLGSSLEQSWRSVKRTTTSYQESNSDDGDNGPIMKRRTRRKEASPFYLPSLSSRKRKQPTPVFRGGKRRKLELEPWEEDSDLEGEIEKMVLERDPIAELVKMEDLDYSCFEKLPAEVSAVNIADYTC